jgi:hypothetical protein
LLIVMGFSEIFAERARVEGTSSFATSTPLAIWNLI